MSFVNVGAYVDGQRPKTKKALKDAMRENPAGVSFDKTAVLFDGSGSFTGDAIPTGVTLSVCGPDPYTKRAWYASVTSTGRVS